MGRPRLVDGTKKFPIVWNVVLVKLKWRLAILVLYTQVTTKTQEELKHLNCSHVKAWCVSILVGNADMTVDRAVARYHDVLTNDTATGHSHSTANTGVIANLAVVCNMDLIINDYIGTDDGIF